MGPNLRYADKLIKENLQILNILVVMLMLILGLPYELFHPFYDAFFRKGLKKFVKLLIILI